MVLPRALTADVASCAPLPCAAASSLGLCSVPSRTRGFCWLLPACCLRADEHLLEQSSKPLTFASQNELPIVSCTSSTQIKHSVKFGPGCFSSSTRADTEEGHTCWQPGPANSCCWRVSVPTLWPMLVQQFASGSFPQAGSHLMMAEPLCP